MFAITNEVQTLKEYLTSIAKSRAGERIGFMEIEQETGVVMDIKGKGYLRNAAKYCGVEYSGIPKYGILLAGPTNGSDIVGGRVARIDNATRRAALSTKNIINMHEEDMCENEQSNMRQLASLLGAIIAQADIYKRLKKQVKGLPSPVNTV